MAHGNTSTAQRKRVLVAEDDPVSADPLRRLLTHLGYQALGPAADAVTAMDMAARLSPDIALVDILLPDAASGLGLGQAIGARGIPVVFMTARRDQDILSGVAEARPYGLLLKPLDRFQLAVALEGALRLRAEELLAQRCQDVTESERRFRAVFEQAGVGVNRQTPEGLFLEVNERFARMVGRTPMGLVGRSFRDISHPDDLAARGNDREELLDGRRDTVVREKRYVRPDGSVIWCRVTLSAIRDETGRPEGVLAVAADITDQRRAEIELNNQLSFQRSLMDAAVNPIYVQDPEGHYVSLNRAFETFLGVSIQSALGLTAREIFSEETGEFLADKDREILEAGGVQRFEVALEDASGRERHLVFHRARFDDADGRPQGIVGVATDVTDSKRVEKELRDEQEVLRRILSGIRAGIFIIDPRSMVIEDVNPVAEELCGRTREALVGHTCQEIGWRYTDGRRLTECILAERNLINEEMRLERPDGRILPIVKTVVSAMRRGQLRLFEIVFDVSERKALERQLAVAQKLESVGELAAGIAHEINTPTQYIGDNLHFLATAFDGLSKALADVEAVARRLAALTGDPADLAAVDAARSAADVDFLLEEAPRALEQSVEGVARVTAIVSAMKKFSHPGGEEKTFVDINAAVENTVTVAKNEWKYVADVELALDRSLPPVLCLPGDFNQVLLNILVNAAHAVADKVKGTADKGRIVIATTADGAFLKLTVADTGTGIAEENRPKIFDPFFTTKEVGKGTGQGLAITHNIVVVKHGGSIDFESEPGVGTTFTVRIPFAGDGGTREHTGETP
ncbi:MAG: PAS domain S-box protein [Solidesulfovibrio sp. DCME]|uniref:hybrid sensor histidine kinase/response regulator n=1 Tax=Solidesulfovibrio sp. DCME TaxID=3447380 RepID=UPI003D0AF1E4